MSKKSREESEKPEAVYTVFSAHGLMHVDRGKPAYSCNLASTNLDSQEK